jgi:hypothetical protein
MWTEDKIEQLYDKIKEQEKIYALAIKMKRDLNSLKNLKAGITKLKMELQELMQWYKPRGMD